MGVIHPNRHENEALSTMFAILPLSPKDNLRVGYNDKEELYSVLNGALYKGTLNYEEPKGLCMGSLCTIELTIEQSIVKLNTYRNSHEQ